MYRPGMGVDPWYENFKFFLTYWLLSNNNRDRMGDADQLPPPHPPPTTGGPTTTGHGFMTPPHNNNKPGGENHSAQNNTNLQQQNPSAKSPSGIPSPSSSENHGNPSTVHWDNLGDKNSHSLESPRHGQNHNGPLPPLSETFNGNLSSFKHTISHGPHNHIPHPGNHPSNHIGHHGNGPGTSNSMLPEHIIVDKDRRHVCPHCYKGFRSRQQLNQHNLVHSGVRKYHCLYCERSFKQLSHLQQHHRIHTGEKPYRCPLDGCDKAFAQMSNLQHHMRQHDKTTFGQKQCMCPFCDRGYASEKSLKSHLSKMHPDSKFLGMGGQRSGLPLSEDQGHSMLTGSQSRMMHSNSLPMMHASMKSPLTPPGGPLELTVNSHSRNMGTDSRKYSLDSNKFPMVGDLPHDSKNFQRSLSERIPDRGPEKLENILDQRYGFQNHFREVNRFGDRSFEPFSPSRLNEAVRSFDFKEIEAKLLDPSLSGEKFQRMAENFNEFRSRFQDQMFRRDGMRQGGYQMDGRNMLPEMTDRNSFFNSRSDNNDLANRERFEISRSFNRMSVNDVDNFGNNRDDNMRNRNRDEMGSRNDLNSPNYHRGRESAAENMSMNIKNQMDMRRNNLGLEQNSSIRNNALSADNIISRPGELSHPDNPHVVSEPRPAIMSASEREMAMSSRHSHQMKPTSQSDLMALRQGQRMESLSETEIMSLRQQQCRSMESNEAEMLSIRHRQSNGLNSASEIEMMQMRHMSQNGLELHNDTDMMSLRPIPGSQMENNNEQGMMPLHRRRADLGTNVMNTRMFASHMDMDGMRSSCHDISPRPGMMSNGPNRVDGVTHMEMVERSREQNNLSYEGRMHSSTDIIKSSQSEYGMMSRNSMMMSHEREKRQHRPEDVAMETGVKMATMEAERNVSTPKSRLVSTGNICSNMEVSSTNQGYLEKSSEQHLLNQDSVIQDSMNLTQSGGLQNSMINHHGSSKENSTSAMMDDGDIDFDGRGNEKNSASPNNLSDPNMIRQRKQRKPANPQHVFMPSLDHYTSFAVDEGEECSPLI